MTWGCADHGQLGRTNLDGPRGQAIPRVVEALTSFEPSDVACGGSVTSALCNGELTSWGGGHCCAQPLWLQDHFCLARWIACGALSTWAVVSNATLLRWDMDPDQLSKTYYVTPVGVGAVRASYCFPKYIDPPNWDDSYTSLACGSLHSVVIFQGQAYTIGCNDKGQLGVGDTTDREKLTLCHFDPGKQISFISCGGKHTAAISKSGDLFTWGNGNLGQLGLGEITTANIPERVSLLPERAHMVACGDNHTMAVSEAGHLFAFGDNSTGQLGLGDLTQRNIPTLVNGIPRVHQIAAGGAFGQGHTIAVAGDTGITYSWGSNKCGQLGHGDFENRNIPTVILALQSRRIIKISCGWLHSACIAQSPQQLAVTPRSPSRSLMGDFSTLPGETLFQILQYLGPSSLCHLSQTCHALNDLCSNNELWKELFITKPWDTSIKKYMKLGNLPLISQCHGNYKNLFALSHDKIYSVPGGACCSSATNELLNSLPPQSFLSSLLPKSFSFFSKTRASPETRFIVNGLDAAGKTSIMQKIGLGTVSTTIPTTGFNVETIQWNAINIVVWDVGGADKIRPLWRIYYAGTSAVIWVVDCHDPYRFPETEAELFRTANEPGLGGLPFLIFANKQDIPGAVGAHELSRQLHLDNLALMSHPMWLCQPSCATTGDGLIDGFLWLLSALEHTRATPPRPQNPQFTMNDQFGTAPLPITFQEFHHFPFSEG
ncbi:ADPribosylation factor subfamily protein [Pelomyxa schiedti]|nr:ADPribosylation factor subfamily protein [Pelomyxa schiedti]